MGTGGEGALGRGFGGIVQMSPAVPRWQDEELTCAEPSASVEHTRV